MNFLFPHGRGELLIRTILTRQWDEEAWPMVREKFKKAMALRSRLRRAMMMRPHANLAVVDCSRIETWVESVRWVA